MELKKRFHKITYKMTKCFNVIDEMTHLLFHKKIIRFFCEHHLKYTVQYHTFISCSRTFTTHSQHSLSSTHSIIKHSFSYSPSYSHSL